MALDSARIYVDNIAAAMAQADPDNAAAYAANADDYKQQIPMSWARCATPPAPCPRIVAIWSPPKAPLAIWPAISADRDVSLAHQREGQGTPQQVRALIDAMRDTGAPVIFSESTISDRPARSIAAETGADYGGVLYVDSLSDTDGPVPTYLYLLRVTSQTIVDALADG